MSELNNNETIITKIELFDFINCFFTDKKRFSRITDSAKSSHSFMLYRFLAIKLPVEIQQINKIHDVSIIDSLHNAMCKGRVPNWIYTKSKKSIPDKLAKFSTQLIIDFCKLQNIEYASFEFLYEMNEKFVIDELIKLKELQDQKIQKTKNKTSK